jgi:RNA polymerase sigma factor (sigma-70 family)
MNALAQSTTTGTRSPAPAGPASPPDESPWDAPLFEVEAEVVEAADAASHNEIVDAVGALWDQLSSLDGGQRSADGELLDEAFTRRSLDIGPIAEPLPAIGPSRLIAAWPVLRMSLIRLLDHAREQGYVLQERLVDHLPVQCVTADTLQTLGTILMDNGVMVLDEPPPDTELLLDAPERFSGCAPSDLVDEELAPGSDACGDIASIYFRQATAIPLLSRDEERALARSLEQARRSFLQLMTGSLPAIAVLREMLADVRTGRVRAQRLFDWLQERTDNADADEDSFESEAGAQPAVADTPDSHLARIGAACTRMVELLQAGPAVAPDDAAFVVLRDELVDQLAATRFSGYAMKQLVERLRRPEHERVDADDLARMASAAAAYRKCRNRMIEANLRLVMWVARKYRWAGMPLCDLLQEGNLGLMRAVDRFDHRREARFSTYATWWIRQGITRSIGNDLRVVRLPVHVHETLNRIRQAQRLLDPHDGTEPAPALIAEHVAMPEARVRRLLGVSSDALNMEFWEEEEVIETDDEATSRTRPGVLSCDDSFDGTVRQQTEGVIGQVLSLLPAREARILSMRFGIGDGNERTLEEIGVQFNLTRERIRQIETKALKKLRHPVRRGFLETLTDGFHPDPRREVLWERSDEDES